MHPSDEGHHPFNAAGKALSAGVGSLVVVPRFTEHSFVVDAPGSAQRTVKEGEVPMPLPEVVTRLSRGYDQLAVPGIPMATTKQPEAYEFVTQGTPTRSYCLFYPPRKAPPRYLWEFMSRAEPVEA